MASIDDAPECQECDGHCCAMYKMERKADGKPWMRRRLEKEAIAQNWRIARPAVISGGYVRVYLWCQDFADGRCSIYAERPTDCRIYPIKSDLPSSELNPGCALLDRKTREYREQIMVGMG